MHYQIYTVLSTRRNFNAGKGQFLFLCFLLALVVLACLNLVALAHIPKYGWDGGEKLWCHEEPSFLLPAP